MRNAMEEDKNIKSIYKAREANANFIYEIKGSKKMLF
jgi:hypothetical protein